MTTFDLAQIDDFAATVEQEADEFRRQHRGDLGELTLDKTQKASPVVTGEFRNSLTFWVGDPSVGAARAQGQESPMDPAEAHQLLEGQPLDVEFGVVSYDPAGSDLVRGSSPQAKPFFHVRAASRAIRAAVRRANNRSVDK